MTSPVFFGPNGENPWGVRTTAFQQGLARVTPEEVVHWSTKGLEEAKATFSRISQNLTETTKEGETIRGGAKPVVFSKESAKSIANRTAGIPEIANIGQRIMYLTPSTSGGIEGCNTCGYETGGCSEACFAHGGQLGLPAGRIARQARTQMAWEHPDMFWGLMRHEALAFQKANQKAGLETALRTGGTHEGLFHLMQGSQALHGEMPDAHFIEYSKIQSRGVVPSHLLVPRNYPNMTPVLSVTEHTTNDRIKQGIAEQGLSAAVPFDRKPHAGYPEEITLADSTGNRAAFRTMRVPGSSESIGDASDIRSHDRMVTGIEAGLIPLGAKQVYSTNEEGEGTRGVANTTFIREVDPTRMTAKFELAARDKKERRSTTTPVSAPTKKKKK